MRKLWIHCKIIPPLLTSKGPLRNLDYIFFPPVIPAYSTPETYSYLLLINLCLLMKPQFISFEVPNLLLCWLCWLQYNDLIADVTCVRTDGCWKIYLFISPLNFCFEDNIALYYKYATLTPQNWCRRKYGWQQSWCNISSPFE